jgi:hypothetical protein
MLLRYLNVRKLIGFIFVITAMAGCGGGGGGGATEAPAPIDTTKTAYFIDSAVEGINYSCGDINGTTKSDGEFTYDTTKCSTVTFKLGNLTLGTIAPSSINTTDKKLTIQELVGVARTEVDNPTVLKIATLLQSLNSNSDASDGIKLVNVSSLSGDIDTIDVNTTIASLNKTPLSLNQVQSHLTTSMITAGILDNRPNTFSFTAQTSVEKASTITSTSVTIGGINTPTTISISNGQYSIGTSGIWTDTNGTISNGQTIKVRHTSSSSYDTDTITTLTIGGVAGTFTSKTRIADTEPNTFSFQSITNAPLTTSQTSNEITIGGIEATTNISITGGEYSTDSGATWKSSAGTISNGQKVKVRHTSSSNFNTATTTTLTIGGLSQTFRSTTLILDNIPDSFSFTSQTDVTQNATISSNTVTIGGINAPTAISISGGEYKIGTGSWTSIAGTISNGQTVQVRHTSSSSFDTTTITTVTIGQTSKTFSSKTLVADNSPDNFSFTDQTDVAKSSLITSNSVTIGGINTPTAISISGGEYKIGTGSWTSIAGTISNGQTIQVRHTSSSSYSTPTQTTLTIGGVSSIFNVTTLQDPNLSTDTTPDNFSFTAQTNVVKSSLISSNIATISGINVSISVSISGGEYKIGSGNWTTTAGTISNGQTIQVRHTSSSNFSTTTTTTLTVGGIGKTFSSTTAAIDITPTAFTLNDQINVEKNSTITSNLLTIVGINTPSTVTILDGEYKIGTGNWTSANGTIENNQTIQVRHTSSLSYLTAVTTTLTIGGVSDTFISTTRSVDVTPNTFNFTTQNDVNLSDTITSNDLNITGIEIPVSISISGGEYSIDSGNWTNLDSNISNGQLVKVKHTSANSYDTNMTTTLTIGGVSGTFTSKTRIMDITPEPFTFTSQSNVTKNTLISSTATTITGLEGATSVSISSGSEYSIDDATWTNVTGTITDGQTIKVRHTSSSSFDTTTITTLTIGGVSGTFTTTTEAIDTTPNSFTFTDNPSVTKNTTATSDSITITGINSPASISVVGGYYSINNNDTNWTNATGTISNNQTVRVRHTTATTSLAQTNTTLTIGGVSDTFTTTTDNAYFQAYLISGKAIGGVQFSCGAENGTTQSDGSFTYFCSGSDITFKLNNLVLGKINTDNINFDKNITLQGISGLARDTITSSKLSKIIQFLHSLDEDKDSTNGITIDSKYLDGNGTKIELDGAIESFTDDQLASELIRIGRYPKIKFEAMKDMLKNLKTNGATIQDFAVYPEANATNVGPYTVVKIGFGESMDATTIKTANITGISFSACDYNDTMMLATCKAPTAGLAINTSYTVSVSPNIKNISGVAITRYNFSFTTGTKNIVPKLKTGQTESYNELGESNTTIYDDGHYATTIGTTRSLSRNTTTGIVTDAGTTLSWIDDATATSITKNWTDLQTYCSGLNTGSKTWRIPTMKELSLIADKSRGGITNASIFNTFTNIAHAENTSAYWTSNLDPDDVNLSYAFLFYDGIDQGAAADHNTSLLLNIRCVSGTPTTSGGFVRDDVKEIVMDTSSGLMWQDNETTSLKWSDSTDINNPDSIKYCENLTLAGFTDWRIPNYNELLSTLEMKNYDITATQPVYISPAFKYKSATSYWTSTTYTPDKTKAWTVNFDTTGAISDVNDKIYSSNLRCVRGI